MATPPVVFIRSRADSTRAVATAADPVSENCLIDDDIETLLLREPIEYTEFVSTWCVQIQQEVLNDDIDPEVATSMMQVQGRYHQIGRCGGQRCFRQEAVADGNPNSMKLFL